MNWFFEKKVLFVVFGHEGAGCGHLELHDWWVGQMW